MTDLVLTLLAGMLTIVAPCLLPILLGASIGQRAGAGPALIAAGFVASFAFVALALNAVATAWHFDPNALRKVGLALLLVFGALMIWPAADSCWRHERRPRTKNLDAGSRYKRLRWPDVLNSMTDPDLTRFLDAPQPIIACCIWTQAPRTPPYTACANNVTSGVW